MSAIETGEWMDSLRGVVLGVSGLIGAGKSTFLRVAEKVVSSSENGISVYCSEEFLCQKLLENAIKYPEQFMDLFQIQMQTAAFHRCIAAKEIVKRAPNTLALIERATKENRIFAMNNFIEHCGCATGCHHINHDFMDKVYDPSADAMCKLASPTKYVFLYVRFDVLSKRINKRARPGESEYPAKYLQSLYVAYFRWVLQLYRNDEIIVIDWNEDISCEGHRVAAVAKALEEISRTIRSGDSRWIGTGYFSWWNFNALENFDEKEAMIDETMRMFVDRKYVFATDSKIIPAI